MLKKIGKILAFVVGAVLMGAVALGIRFWVRSRDLPSAGDEDLRLRWSEIPAAENAFAALQEAGEKLRWPEGQDEQVAHLLQGKEADSAAAGSLRSANRDALASLEIALRIDRLQVPREEPGDKTPYSILAWRRLGQLLCLRVRADAKKGELSRALDDGLQLLRFGHMVEGAQGHLLGYMMGNALKSNGLSELRRVLAEKRVSDRELRGLVGRLESLRPEAQSFREALQGDYSYMAALIDDPKQLYSGGEERFERTARGGRRSKGRLPSSNATSSRRTPPRSSTLTSTARLGNPGGDTALKSSGTTRPSRNRHSSTRSGSRTSLGG